MRSIPAAIFLDGKPLWGPRVVDVDYDEPAGQGSGEWDFALWCDTIEVDRFLRCYGQRIEIRALGGKGIAQLREGRRFGLRWQLEFEGIGVPPWP